MNWPVPDKVGIVGVFRLAYSPEKMITTHNRLADSSKPRRGGMFIVRAGLTGPRAP